MEDPLANYTPFSFNLSSSFRPILNPNSDALLSNLKELASKNPDLLVNEGKIIKDGGMDILESDKTMASASKDQIEAPVTISDKNLRGRRPGLGLKRNKFKVIPLPSETDLNQVPTIDLSKYSDPLEFFAAIERMDNAEKEFRRLRGEPEPVKERNFAPVQRRPPRPGLLGMKPTYIRPTVPLTEVPDKNESLFSSQEAYSHNSLSPAREDALPKTDAKNLLPEREVSGAKPAVSTKPCELKELLSCNFDGLDDDGVQSLLQEKLNLKLLDIGKLSLPDLPDFRYHEPNKDTIFRTNDGNEAASTKPLTYSYQLKKSSSNQLSPSLPKSPLASISSFRKNISRLTPSRDPFTTLDIDSSPEVLNKKQADQISFPLNGKETYGALTSPFRLSGNSRSPNIISKKRVDGVILRDQIVRNKGSHENEIYPVGEKNIAVSKNLPSPIAKDITPIDNPEDCLRSPIEEENFAVLGEALLACEAKDIDATSAPIEQDDQIVKGLESIGKEMLTEGSFLENPSVIRGDGEMDDPLNTQSILIEKPNKKKLGPLKSKRKQAEESTEPYQENIPKEPVKKGRKQKAKSNRSVLKEPTSKKRRIEGASPLPSKVDEQLRRQSLYAFGTKLDDGLRRSTRIRMRPLEYWRGERFLYGRIHGSVVSVIGVKYASPAKNEERDLKVKSFVADEYKDLVELASYH